MSKTKIEEPITTAESVEIIAETPKPARRMKTYIFPDIDGGGPSVTIEATSIEEATALFRKGQA